MMSPVLPMQEKVSICCRCSQNSIENLADNCDVFLNSTHNMEQRSLAESVKKPVDINNIHFTFKGKAPKSYGHIPTELTAQPLHRQ